MEEKHNNATPQRPNGDRLLDANLIPIKFEKYITQIRQEEAYHKNGKNAITVFKSYHVTITILALKADEIVQPGQGEPSAILTLQVLEGQLSFESSEASFYLKEKEMLTIHQELSFKARAEIDVICLLTVVK